MKRIEINPTNYIIKYRTPEHAPLKRYAKFQKYLLLKTGVGSDMQSIASHFNNWFTLNAHGKHEESRLEAENLYYNFFAILQEVDYEDLAFACMIHSINGVPLNDVSSDNLVSVISWLSDNGMTKAMVSEEVEDTRSAILKDLRVYFPKFYPDTDDVQYFAKRKQNLMATADKLLQQLESEDFTFDDEIKKLLDDISLYFVELNKPKSFDSEDQNNAVVKLDSQFEQLCSMIESNGTNTRELTLIEFYSRLEYIRKSNKPAKEKNT